MRIETLVRKICGKEGKKKSISIAQVREVVGIISDMIYDQACEHGWRYDVACKNAIDVALYRNGEKRAKAIRNKKK